MTKARDIASAAPAPSTVSVTELGYLDGVSSAIQTQIDGKVASSLVDAKADLITATGDNTPARLAVGNNGETLVADSSASVGLSYRADWAAGKNKIINGDFAINQRAFTSTTANNTYTFDRWLSGLGGSTGTVTFSASTFTAGSAPVAGYESTNFITVQTASQSSTDSNGNLSQRIEDVRTFANQTVCVSFWAKAASGTPKIAVEIDQQFGSGGSTRVTTYAGQATLSTSWARYSVSVAVPSISGKTLGAGNYLGIRLWTSAGTDLNARTGSLGIQNGTIDIWGVQAENGSVATAFQTATGTLAGELAACQRYYLKSYNQATAPGTASNTVGNTGYSAISATATNNRWNVRFPVNMRGTPTVTIYSTSSGTSAKIYNEQAAVDVDAATQYIGESGFHLYTSSGTPTAGHQLLAHYVASAEL